MVNLQKKSSIESKIWEFEEGKDFSLEEQTYHAPQTFGEKKHGAMGARNYTMKVFHILSPELKRVLRQMLTEKSALLMSFDFKGNNGDVREHFRVNNKDNNYEEAYRCQINDEYNNLINYHDGGLRDMGDTGQVVIYYFEQTEKEINKYKKYWQQAERCYQEKNQQSNSELHPTNIPSQGTKCWKCNQLISDCDINQGNYQVENVRCNGHVWKCFKHVKEYNCQAKKRDKQEIRDYEYFPGLEKKWNKIKEKKLRRGYLQKLQKKMKCNLNYLEKEPQKWDKEISSTKKNIAEIENRLEEMKKNDSEYYVACDKVCDKCKDAANSDNKINTFSQETLSMLKEYFQENNIKEIKWKKGELKVTYNNSKADKFTLSDINNDSKLYRINACLQGSKLKSISQNELGINSETNSVNNGSLKNKYLEIAGGIIAVSLVIFLCILLFKKKKKIKNK